MHYANAATYFLHMKLLFVENRINLVDLHTNIYLPCRSGKAQHKVKLELMYSKAKIDRLENEEVFLRLRNKWEESNKCTSFIQ